jgi:tetrahydromethanopterin S-methyltransferase subunit G
MTQSTNTNDREILLEIKADIKELSTKVESIDKRLVAVETKLDFLVEDSKQIKGAQKAQIWTLITILATAVLGFIAAVGKFISFNP